MNEDRNTSRHEDFCWSVKWCWRCNSSSQEKTFCLKRTPDVVTFGYYYNIAFSPISYTWRWISCDMNDKKRPVSHVIKRTIPYCIVRIWQDIRVSKRRSSIIKGWYCSLIGRNHTPDHSADLQKRTTPRTALGKNLRISYRLFTCHIEAKMSY